jgi:hypothetical protein
MQNYDFRRDLHLNNPAFENSRDAQRCSYSFEKTP